jgi:hypothetical protein
LDRQQEVAADFFLRILKLVVWIFVVLVRDFLLPDMAQVV